MMVYVVMQNDFPDSVWTSKDAAEQYAARKRKKSAKLTKQLGGRTVYWHLHEFELQREEGWEDGEYLSRAS